MIELVTFDLDGTIIDDEWAHEKAKTSIARSLGAEGDLSLSYFVGRSNRLFWKNVLDKYHIEGQNIEELVEEQFKRVAEYIEEADQPESPGLTEALKFLKSRGCKIAVASGSDEYFVMSLLGHLHIEQYFDYKITKNHVTCVKPDPDIYLAALRMADTQGTHAMGIEDSTSGCMSLKAAGMGCTVGFSNYGKNPQDLTIADYIIPDHTGIIPIFESRQ